MINHPTVLHSFKSIYPRFQAKQSDLEEWLIDIHQHSITLSQLPQSENFKNILKRFCVSEKQIGKRFFETDREFIYQLTKDSLSGSDIGQRHNFFGKRCLEIFEEIYASEVIPDHLIHVTCTGYLSPSAPQIYFSDQQKIPDITHAYHMGCYASLPAVRMAAAFSQSFAQKVDVVHTEMCSLHLDPAIHSPEQMVVQSLFADGHIKYTIDDNFPGRKLEVQSIKEKIIPGSTKDMTWMPSHTNMQMTLSKEVPDKIRGHLPSFLRELTQESHQKYIFAIHPGGPKIIDHIQGQLELSDEQVSFSRQVLKERGNMSSATLPHIWKEILDSDYSGKVISLAFGPGLTIFGGVFEAKQ